MQTFHFNSTPFIANNQNVILNLAQFPNIGMNVKNDGLRLSISPDAADVVYMSSLPVDIDSSELNDMYEVKVQSHRITFGDSTIYITLVNIEEKPGDWMVTEFVTRHSNVAIPVYFIGEIPKGASSFLKKVLFFAITNLPRYIKYEPMGYIHEAYFHEMLETKNYMRLLKLLVLNGSAKVHPNVPFFNSRSQFIHKMTNINCYGHEIGVLSAMEDIINALMHNKTNVEEDITGNLNMVMALNILVQSDVVKEYSGGLIRLSAYGGFVVDLFESKPL